MIWDILLVDDVVLLCIYIFASELSEGVGDQDVDLNVLLGVRSCRSLPSWRIPIDFEKGCRINCKCQRNRRHIKHFKLVVV